MGFFWLFCKGWVVFGEFGCTSSGAKSREGLFSTRSRVLVGRLFDRGWTGGLWGLSGNLKRSSTPLDIFKEGNL